MSSSAFDDLVAACGGAVRHSGKETICRCPAHKDDNPSLCITVADDGKILLHCFAGCTTESVMQKLGLDMSILAGDSASPRSANGGSGRGWDDRAAAASFYARKLGGTVEAIHEYPGLDGVPRFAVIRIRTPKGKTFRPINLHDGRWHVGAPDRLLPLYRLPALTTATAVLVCEGEKCVDCATKLGVVATTSAHGARSAAKTDWNPLTGKRVCLSPDADQAGTNYATEVATILRVIDAEADIRLLALPDLGPSEDIVDWCDKLRAQGVAEHDIAQELDRLIRSAKPWPAGSSTHSTYSTYSTYSTGGVGNQDSWPEPRPIGKPIAPPQFPIAAAFPPQCERLKAFAEAVATSLQVPVDLPVLLALAAFGLALSRRVEVAPQPDWREILAVYVLALLPSGERKSAVFAKMIKPIREWQRSQGISMAATIASMENEIRVTKDKLSRRRAEAAKQTSQPGDSMEDLLRQLAELEEEKPKPPSMVASEATTEAIADLLVDNNERGMLAAAEGDAIDVMMGRYSQGKPNFGLWLSGHAGDSYEIRRRMRPTIRLERPALTVALAIQPEAAKDLVSSKAAAGRGVLGRFFFSCPQSKVGYRDLQPPPIPIDLNDWYGARLHQLLDKPVPDEPVVLSLSDDAAAQFLAFRATLEADLRPEGRFSDRGSWGSKLAGAVARIAGILHGVANPELTNPVIDAGTMRAALAWVPYLEAHELYVGWVAGDNSIAALAERILAWIGRKSVPDFSHNDCFNAVRTSLINEAKTIDPALDLLEELHWIRVTAEPALPPRRGRPRGSRYQVNPAALGGTRPPLPQNTQNTQKAAGGNVSDASAEGGCQ